jgi:hypothetical protein
MASVTYQTIKLSRGKHASPEDGACVMELASMLAGEPFSDHPASVCPVIAALLRVYNDALDDDHRQVLYVYAAKAVGSRGSRGLEHVRAERLNAWASEREPHGVWHSLRFGRLRQLVPPPPVHVVAARAVHAASTRSGGSSTDVLGFVDELLAIGAPRPSAAQAIVPVEADRGHAASTAPGAP